MNTKHSVDFIDLDHAEDEEEEALALHPRYPWEGSDRDYEYEEVCHILCFLMYGYIVLIYPFQC